MDVLAYQKYPEKFNPVDSKKTQVQEANSKMTTSTQDGSFDQLGFGQPALLPKLVWWVCLVARRRGLAVENNCF